MPKRSRICPKILLGRDVGHVGHMLRRCGALRLCQEHDVLACCSLKETNTCNGACMSKGCSESCASNYPSHLPILQLLQRTGPDWPTLPSPSQQSWCSWATLADGRAIRAAGFQTPASTKSKWIHSLELTWKWMAWPFRFWKTHEDPRHYRVESTTRNV